MFECWLALTCVCAIRADRGHGTVLIDCIVHFQHRHSMFSGVFFIICLLCSSLEYSEQCDLC